MQNREILHEAAKPDAAVTLSPWFKLICESSLFPWWDSLAKDQLPALGVMDVQKL